jgi:hypothetical protein
MIQAFRRTLPILILLSAVAAQAQFYKNEFKNSSFSVGGFGEFTTQLSTNPTSGNYRVPFGTAGVSTYPVTISNNQQFTTDSAGFITSFQFHPVSWAGVELNYSYTRYSERYTFNYSTPANSAQYVNAPTDADEFTAAYSFHPKHIPLQPFLNLGGGAIDFAPTNLPNQWRGAGLAELGFDLPTHMSHLGFRVEGRALFYRAPNFDTPEYSTRGWSVTEEPSASVFYKF